MHVARVGWIEECCHLEPVRKQPNFDHMHIVVVKVCVVEGARDYCIPCDSYMMLRK